MRRVDPRSGQACGATILCAAVPYRWLRPLIVLVPDAPLRKAAALASRRAIPTEPVRRDDGVAEASA